METWKAISGWEGWYEVSDQGRVRSLDRISIAGGFPATYKGKILATPPGKNGYQTVCLTSPGRRQYRNVHRLVAEAFIGPCPEGLEVCHQNGVRGDNRAVNLRYDTRSGNAKDRVAHGTASTGEKTRGERNGNAVLTAEAVMYIRANPQLSLNTLARELGVRFTTIHSARTGKTWRHV